MPAGRTDFPTAGRSYFTTRLTTACPRHDQTPRQPSRGPACTSGGPPFLGRAPRPGTRRLRSRTRPVADSLTGVRWLREAGKTQGAHTSRKEDNPHQVRSTFQRSRRRLRLVDVQALTWPQAYSRSTRLRRLKQPVSRRASAEGAQRERVVIRRLNCHGRDGPSYRLPTQPSYRSASNLIHAIDSTPNPSRLVPQIRS